MAAYLDCRGISFLSPCRGGIYDARHCGFDKSNPYRSAPKVRYVQSGIGKATAGSGIEMGRSAAKEAPGKRFAYSQTNEQQTWI